jgi:hypothetical protein
VKNEFGDRGEVEAMRRELEAKTDALMQARMQVCMYQCVLSCNVIWDGALCFEV